MTMIRYEINNAIGYTEGTMFADTEKEYKRIMNMLSAPNVTIKEIKKF